MMSQLPFSQACENNKAPILEVLKNVLSRSSRVLEIGSGTGQHAVYFAPALPHLVWQTSDLPDNHPGIIAWQQAYPADNLLPPIVVDLQEGTWPGGFDAVFSANTTHIIGWPLVENMLLLAGRHLPEGGVLALYGPFNYKGHYTSESNRAFDEMLKRRDPSSGIRDVERVIATARGHGLESAQDHAMPANNRLLVFRKAARQP
jgi:SAM-dependent methyltransferase